MTTAAETDPLEEWVDVTFTKVRVSGDEISGDEVYVRQSVHLRNPLNGPAGPVVSFSRDAWRRFVEQVKLGRHDL